MFKNLQMFPGGAAARVRSAERGAEGGQGGGGGLRGVHLPG